MVAPAPARHRYDLSAVATRTRLEHDERRAQILAAARVLFSERPFSSVSTTEIAQAAGIARGLLNHYFGTKRDLYLEVVRDLVRMPSFVPEHDPGDDPRQVWERSVDRWLDFIAANREMWLVAIGAGETGQEGSLHAILDQARERTAAVVLTALGLDDDVPDELRAMVRAYGALAEEVTREWLVRKRLSREQARILLVGSLPPMITDLLPEMLGSA